MQKMNIRLRFFIIFLILAVVSTIFINKYYQHNQQIRLEQATKTYTRAYDTAYKGKQKLSKVILTGFEKKGRLPQRLAALQTATKKQKDKIRADIYKDLKLRYNTLRAMGISQVQIHLPNNESFLKMYTPNIYGDNLTTLRPSVALTNQNHKAYNTIEIGELNTALRFVYPIFYKDAQVGSIEISHQIGKITSSIMQQYYVLSNFFVKKDIVDKKQFKGTTNDYYAPSHHKGYYYNKTVLKELKKVSREDMKELKPAKQITDKIKEMGQKGIPSSLYDKSIGIIITVIPIINKLTKENIAFLTIRSKANYPTDYIYFIYILSVCFLALATHLLYNLVNKKDELAQIVQEKTQQLNDINQNLEQKVKEKTKKQSDLLSLFNKGEIVLFRWNNDESWSTDFVSQNTEQLLGYTKEEFMQNHIAYGTLIYNDDKQLVTKEITDAVAQNKDFFTHKPYRVTTKKGEVKWILNNTLLVKDEQGNITHFLGTILDITQLKESERVIEEQSKLASMGEMIGNIAHQWRQPLSVISVGATGLKFQKEYSTLTDEQLIKTCDAINDNAQYLSKTIDDFRNFIKGDREIVSFKLSDDIESFLHLVEGSIKNNNIEIIENLDENITLNGYPNELAQCCINIFNNSKDAFKEKEVDERLFFISTYLEDDKVIITFKDNAGGIPKDILPRVFEPYFTTKHKSQGTGLGLHMTYNLIVKGMSGTITADNIEYKYKKKEYFGAVFKIELGDIKND